ncbi:MAG: DUF5946 family protein [Chloroflexota bacterium]
MMTDIEPCPGCAALLPPSTGSTHRYIGASPACWERYSLLNAGEPSLTPHPRNGLLVDAYAAQHPGISSPQAIQSVAVHLLTLYGILIKGIADEQTVWIRQRALRTQDQSRRDRFGWLEPPSFEGQLTVVDIVQAATPDERTEQLQSYVESVWQTWRHMHLGTISDWYDQFVLPDRL